MVDPSTYQLSTETVLLGAWRILAELARGGMAAVYLAVRDQPAGPGPAEIVAIKQIHAHLAHDPDFVAMLTDEARIASQINHPNVVEIRELCLGDTAADNYVVMEYAAGEALSLVLKASIARGMRIGYAVAASIGADVAGALHAAHELRGEDGRLLEVVHRDVSPQNIILTYDGRIKLTDFGIAKALGRLQRTHQGEIKGKLAYMSPEQAFGRSVDRRSDVYSLGIVLYELCLGRRLFGGKTDAETVKNIIHHVVPAPQTLDPDFPAALQEILLGMLTADVNQRFQSAGAVERALRAFTQNSGLLDPDAPRSELVRTLEPARYQAKTALVNRALEQFALARPAVRKGSYAPSQSNPRMLMRDPDEMPTVSMPRSRVPSAPKINPLPTAQNPVQLEQNPQVPIGPPAGSVGPPRTSASQARSPYDQTFQAPKPPSLGTARQQPLSAGLEPSASFPSPPSPPPYLPTNSPQFSPQSSAQPSPFGPPRDASPFDRFIPAAPVASTPPSGSTWRPGRTALLVVLILLGASFLSLGLFAVLQLLRR